MKRLPACILINLFLLTGSIYGQDNPAAEKCIPCEKLTSVRLPDVKITEAVQVAEGTSFCKIMGVIGKEIKFELLLPDTWNGIFIMGGGGGFVGTIQNAARSSVNEGFATSGTDTGHEGKSGLSAEWAFNNMERQLNFGHLAVHRTAEVSKAIIGNYYGYYPKYSYFIGCSRGGGQAMVEAQRYPEDFDGIIVGAPAFNWAAIGAEFIQNTRALYPSNLSEGLITNMHLRILQDAILKQCDLIDGIADSILNDPTRCKFDFASLPKCPGDVPGENCFTINQLNAIRTIYGGIDIGGGIAYPGFPLGGEAESGSWNTWITGSGEFTKSIGYPSLHGAFGIELYKYLVLNDPDMNYLDYDLNGSSREVRYASAYLDATSTDYSGFKNRKGKIIFWHGWNDPALSAFATIDHYNAVKANNPDISDFMRLYLLPGVLHCGGGKGPSQVDWIALIRDWVENGKPPERIVASKSVNGKDIMTRPLFPYPAEAVYDGKGDPDKEASFKLK